jgi:hypothetical protein
LDHWAVETRWSSEPVTEVYMWKKC